MYFENNVFDQGFKTDANVINVTYAQIYRWTFKIKHIKTFAWNFCLAKKLSGNIYFILLIL